MLESAKENLRVGTKFLAIFFIRLYRKTISFDHGLMKFFFPLGTCKYRPTCSEYAEQAIEKKGLFKGSWLIFKRLMRCNPFSKGGYDPVQ